METVEIPLRNTGRYAVIDVADAPRALAMGVWREMRGGYAVTKAKVDGRQRTLLLHHLVMGKPPPGHVIDHINRDGLDNRRANLRIVLEAVNRWNLTGKGRGKSGYRGIFWDKGMQIWFVALVKENRRYPLGHCKPLPEAMAAGTLGIALLFGRHTGYYDDANLGRDFDEVCAHAEETFAKLSAEARRRLLGLKDAVHEDSIGLFERLEKVGSGTPIS